MHGPWAATRHTPFGKALRRFSVRPCYACRCGRVCHLVGLSKIGAGRLGSWRPHCCNSGCYSGALDDRRARRFGDGCDNRTMSAAAVRTLKGGHKCQHYPVRRTGIPVQRCETAGSVRLHECPPTCMWTVKAPLRRGFPFRCGRRRAGAAVSPRNWAWK